MQLLVIEELIAAVVQHGLRELVEDAASRLQQCGQEAVHAKVRDAQLDITGWCGQKVITAALAVYTPLSRA